jgi:hypothetical protein
MTTSEFLRQKNCILRDTIGLNFDLVPEEQIIDLPQNLCKPLSNATTSRSCPYCVGYSSLNACDHCVMCPMGLAGNRCSFHEKHDNTWQSYVKYCLDRDIKLHSDIESPAFHSMCVLIAKYNNELAGEY